MTDYKESEQMLRHRDKVYQAELSRIKGAPVYTMEEVDAKMGNIFHAYAP